MDEHSSERVSVRRAPKFGVFLAAGAAVGILLALILTFSFDGSSVVSPNTGVEYSTGQVFGFLLLVCIPVLLAIAAVIALVFDRRSRRHTHEVTIDHESVRDERDDD
ncbi:hypothetical protein GCM10022200_19430 [Microbacterium awajiense]|uniref:Potassium transporter Trk n=1 Tax=Microbacterium awajiense TaxID=415214 RepID=A0ABP7ANE9_9MICO